MKNPFKKKDIKKETPKVVKKETPPVCTNCENSGRECRTCGFGTEAVV